MRSILLLLSAVGLVAIAALPVSAQPTDDLNTLRKDVDALKESQKSIQSDLQEIKNLLQQQRARPAAPPQEAVVSVDGATVKGDPNAKVTLVDFTDYQ